MKHLQSRGRWLLVPFLALSLVTAACGDDDDETTSDTESEAASSSEGGSDSPGDASGTVTVTGSSTVEPISSLAAEAYQGENGEVEISVEGPGTGDGFEAFCAGEADITDASRPITEEEITACEEGGVEFVELKVGFDGISVLTSPDNDVECLSFADLYALTGPESQGFEKWTDASTLAEELGSDTELPDADLALTGPGEESGTYDSFIEIVFGDIAEARVEAGTITEDQAETTRPDYSASANDNTIIQNIEGSEGSLGWVGFAFAEDAGDTVKQIDIAEEAGGECVTADAETIADGTYPLSRSLFIYVNKAKAEENSAVSGFVDFYLEGLTEFVEGANYVALPDDQVETTTTAWADKTVGTQES